MHYESQLRFLCDFLKKYRVKVSFQNINSEETIVPDEMFNMIFGYDAFQKNIGSKLYKKIEPSTIYKLTDSYKLCYIFLQLPYVANQNIMIIGPYLSEQVDMKSVLEIGEKHGVLPKKQKLLQDFYSNIPVIKNSNPFFLMLETFGDHIWEGEKNYKIIDIEREILDDIDIISKKRNTDDSENIIANMELMQRRYDFENELINAVAMGHEHKANQIMENLNQMTFERRVSDPVRNLKNYSIIMNTLLRKAAETGGVHPIYINEVSSAYALKIEQSSSTKAISELMVEMFRSYCILVRKYTTKQYSPLIQKVITQIHSDLSANLSLQTLSRAHNISAGYLSSLFKKETGKTLTEYITGLRMQRAMQLLSSTRLQIQTIALHCGIMDLQYFSKQFKKFTGKTPKEYRKTTI